MQTDYTDLRRALDRPDNDAVLRALEPHLTVITRRFRSPVVTDDELLQIARIGAHAALLSFHGDRRNLRHFWSWVSLVARRHLLDEIRHTQQAGRLQQWDGLTDDPRDFTGGDDPADLVAERDQLQRAVIKERARRAGDVLEVQAALPAHQARAFELVYAECLSYAAAADRLGVSVKTVRVYVWRGRRVLDATLPQPAHLRPARDAA